MLQVLSAIYELVKVSKGSKVSFTARVIARYVYCNNTKKRGQKLTQSQIVSVAHCLQKLHKVGLVNIDDTGTARSQYVHRYYIQQGNKLFDLAKKSSDKREFIANVIRFIKMVVGRKIKRYI